MFKRTSSVSGCVWESPVARYTATLAPNVGLDTAREAEWELVRRMEEVMAAYREDAAVTRRGMEALLGQVEREALRRQAASVERVVTASGTERPRPRTTPEKPAAGVPLIPRPLRSSEAGGGRSSGSGDVGGDDRRGSGLHAPCPHTQAGGEARGPWPRTQAGGEARGPWLAVMPAAPVPNPRLAVMPAAPGPAPRLAVMPAALVPNPRLAVMPAAPVPAPRLAVMPAAPVSAPRLAVMPAAPVPNPRLAVKPAAPVPSAPVPTGPVPAAPVPAGPVPVGPAGGPVSARRPTPAGSGGLGPVARATGQRRPPARPPERLSGRAGILSWSMGGGVGQAGDWRRRYVEVRGLGEHPHLHQRINRRS